MVAVPRLCSAAPLLALLAAPPAAAQTLRYQATTPGGVAITGNTLGLAKELDLNGPGTRDSIGTFITEGTSVDDNPLNAGNPWPAGTTAAWAENLSTALLDLPAGASVLYAELVWGGSYAYGGEDVTGNLDVAVTLDDGTAAHSVTPDASASVTLAADSGLGYLIRYYVRAAEVTAIVQGAGAGLYAVGGVPATQDQTVNSLNAAGWTLLVAYHDPAAPVRTLSVHTGGPFVLDGAGPADFTTAGWCTPPAGNVSGTLCLSALEGDANLTGDTAAVAPSSAGPFHALFGPNNPTTNFFASQLNGADGQLETAGSFGNLNHDAPNGTNTVGGRQGWDVTTVPLSTNDATLQNNQTQLVVRLTTTGDAFVPVAVGIAIDLNAARLESANTTLTASPAALGLGETTTVTAVAHNSAPMKTAEALRLRLPLPTGLTLVSVTTDGVPGDISGAAVDAAGLAAGMDAGTLGPDTTRTVVLVLEATAAPTATTYPLTATWAFEYTACIGDPAIADTVTRSTALTFIPAVEPDAGPPDAGPQDSGPTNDDGAPAADSAAPADPAPGDPFVPPADPSTPSGDSQTSDTPTPEGGCDCRTAPAPGAWLWLLGLVALTDLRSRRQRRSARR